MASSSMVLDNTPTTAAPDQQQNNSNIMLLQNQHPGPQIFQAVVEDDYDRLTKLFAVNARNSLVSYISMKSRWARQQETMAKSGKHQGSILFVSLFVCLRNKGRKLPFWLLIIGFSLS
jgi:hypothetical protein